MSIEYRIGASGDTDVFEIIANIEGRDQYIGRLYRVVGLGWRPLTYDNESLSESTMDKYPAVIVVHKWWANRQNGGATYTPRKMEKLLSHYVGPHEHVCAACGHDREAHEPADGCGHCGGSGVDPDTDRACPTCRGRGDVGGCVVEVTETQGFGTVHCGCLAAVAGS